MTARIGITWRTAAALAAVVVLLPLLVFVDPSPSSAHNQTVRRCAFDPFAGQQCWKESVSHTHTSNNYSPPPDTSPPTTTAPPPTTVPVPNHYSPPPDTSPRPKTCPAGTTGTPPDCLPVPSDNTRHANSQRCPAGTTGTPPDCLPVPSDNTRHADNQGDGSDSSDSSDGAKDGGEGEPDESDSAESEGGDCESDDCGDESTSEGEPDPSDAKNLRNAQDSGTTSTQSACPTLLGTHPHLDREQHRHELQSGTMADCHDATPGHQHSDGTEDTSDGPNYSGAGPALEAALGRVGDLIATGTAESLEAARSALDNIAADVREDVLRGVDAIRRLNEEIDKLWRRIPGPARTFVETLAKGVACGALVAAAAKSTVATAGAAAPAWVVWAASPPGQLVLGATCAGLIEAAEEIIGGDDDSGADGADTAPSTPEPTDSGKPAPPTQSDSNVADNPEPADSGNPESITPPTTAPPSDTVTEQDWRQARAEWKRGLRPRSDVDLLFNRWLCQQGWQSACDLADGIANGR